MQMRKIPISLVKKHDFPSPQAPTELSRSLGVILFGRVDNGKTWQQTLQIQSHVALRRRLAPPVLGPIHTLGHQFYGRRVNHVDGRLEAVRKSFMALPCPKALTESLQVAQLLPEQLLSAIFASRCLFA